MLPTLLTPLLLLAPSATPEPAPRPDLEAIRALIDTNGDGTIDAAERRALRQAVREARAERHGDAGGRERRTDRAQRPRGDRARRGDGRLSERRARPGLGRSSREEGRGAGQGDRRPPSRLLRRLDRNGDGRIGPLERRMAMKRAEARREGRLEDRRAEHGDRPRGDRPRGRASRRDV